MVPEEDGAAGGDVVDAVLELVRRSRLVVLDLKDRTPEPAPVETIGGEERGRGERREQECVQGLSPPGETDPFRLARAGGGVNDPQPPDARTPRLR